MSDNFYEPSESRDDIIGLFFKRDERALELADRVFGRRLYKIAFNVTGDRMISEEVVNDAYLALWNRIPPERPLDLGAFSSVIVRNIAVDRVRKETASKRNAPVEELTDSIPDSAVEADDGDELAALIGRFLRTQKKTARIAFVIRYFEEETIEGVAERTGMTVPAVKSSLHRTRERLRKFLLKEGYTV